MKSAKPPILLHFALGTFHFALGTLRFRRVNSVASSHTGFMESLLLNFLSECHGCCGAPRWRLNPGACSGNIGRELTGSGELDEPAPSTHAFATVVQGGLAGDQDRGGTGCPGRGDYRDARLRSKNPQGRGGGRSHRWIRGRGTHPERRN